MQTVPKVVIGITTLLIIAVLSKINFNNSLPSSDKSHNFIEDKQSYALVSSQKNHPEKLNDEIEVLSKNSPYIPKNIIISDNSRHDYPFFDATNEDELVEIFKIEKNSFAYKGDTWVDFLGFDDFQKPIFKLSGINFFDAEAYEAGIKIFTYELEKLYVSEDFGEFEQKIEDEFRSYIENIVGSPFTVEVLSCKRYKCMAQVSYENLEYGAVSALEKAYKILSNSKERKCTGSRSISPNNRYLVIAQCRITKLKI
jgi:hypothetical protein